MCEHSKNLIVCRYRNMTARQTEEWLRARQKDVDRHEQNCAALDFDGDYRVVVYEQKCTCRKRHRVHEV